MVLHIVKAEKFTPQIIENFSIPDTQFHFFVFSADQNKILSKNSKHISYLSLDDQFINSKIEQINPKSLILHAMHLEFAQIVNNLNIKPKIAWYCWGFDVYGLPRIKPNTYAPLTNSYLLQNIRHLRFGRSILKNRTLRKFYYLFNKKEIDRYSIIYKTFNKVDYFVTYLKCDYEIFTEMYPNDFKFIYCPFSTIDQYLAGDKSLCMNNDATNILIGNSNSYESNHLDIFTKLNKGLENHKDLKIYVPLNYGVDEIYKSEVIALGKTLFNNSFNPIINFLDRKLYMNILKTCSTGIFFHFRQQAMGNIIALLYLGARVYLSRNNPTLSFFKENNIEIFVFEEDFDTYRNLRLSQQSIINNRDHLDRLFNKESVLKHIKDLISVLS